MKNILDDENEDPHKEAAADLVKKINKQNDGPLFDNSQNEYLKTNQNTDGIGGAPQANNDVPNYQDIANEANKEEL